MTGFAGVFTCCGVVCAVTGGVLAACSVLPLAIVLPLFVLVLTWPGAPALPWVLCCVPAMPLPVAGSLDEAGDDVGLPFAVLWVPLVLAFWPLAGCLPAVPETAFDVLWVAAPLP